jgi:hypothetical protein
MKGPAASHWWVVSAVFAAVVLVGCDPGYHFSVRNACSVRIGFADAATLTEARQRLGHPEGEPIQVAPRTTKSFGAIGTAGDNDRFLVVITGPLKGKIVPLRATSGNVSYRAVIQGDDCRP